MPFSKRDAEIFVRAWQTIPVETKEMLILAEKGLHEAASDEDRRKYEEQILDTQKEMVHYLVVEEGSTSEVEELLTALKVSFSGDATDIHRQYVSRRVSRLRNQRKMTQAQLAKKSGLHQSYISKIENGQFCSTYKTIARLALALDVEVFDIDPTFDDIGRTIESIRLRRELTRRNLAEIVGVNEEVIADIETGQQPINPEAVGRIAQALDVLVREIDPMESVNQRDVLDQ